MRHTLVHILLLLLFATSLYAERITLRSGKQLTGTLIAQTDGVLLLQTTQGQRFQFPMEEVLSIEKDIQEAETDSTTNQEKIVRPVAFRIAVSGGMGAVSGEKCGGMTTAELQIGTRQIAGKDIFLGGSVGYAGAFLSPIAHVIPLQAVVAVPIPLEQTQKYGAEVNTSLGYAFATKGNKGGLTGSLAAGVRIALANQKALFAGATAQFIQTERERYTLIGNETYTHNVGTTVWLIGAKITIQL